MRTQIPPRALGTLGVGLALAGIIGGTLSVPASADPIDRRESDPAARKAGTVPTSKVLPDKWFVQVSGVGPGELHPPALQLRPPRQQRLLQRLQGHP